MNRTAVDRPVEAVDDIVLITVDSLRSDRLYARSQGVNLMPNVVELSNDSVVFDEGIAPGPGTADSVPAILTGGYPSQFPGFALPQANTNPLTIAEHLFETGFSTAGFNQNNLISRRYNFDRGFDLYYDISEETREDHGQDPWRLRIRDVIEGTPLMSIARAAQTFLMENFGKSLYALDEPGDVLTDEALVWLEKTDGKRFLWMHYMDTHHPYYAPQEVMAELGRQLSEERVLKLSRKARSDGESLTDGEIRDLKHAYDSAVRFVDKQIGRILDYLEDKGILSETLVIVTSDHGEEFYEHGAFGHRDALWDELICVPLVVYYPPIGAVDVDGQAPIQDIVDSVIDGAGWFDHLTTGYDRIISETSEGREGIRCVRGTDYKLIVDGNQRTVTRIDDGDESVVEITDVPEERLEALEAELAESHDTFTSDRGYDQSTLEEDLSALGYLDE